jgi:ABC-type lipoprotein export system ATPase subunit
LMVTHDNDLAQRATRTIIIADGEIVNEVHRNGYRSKVGQGVQDAQTTLA